MGALHSANPASSRPLVLVTLTWNYRRPPSSRLIQPLKYNSVETKNDNRETTRVSFVGVFDDEAFDGNLFIDWSADLMRK